MFFDKSKSHCKLSAFSLSSLCSRLPRFAPIMLFAKPPCPKKCELTIKNIATMRAMSKAQLRGCFIVGAVAVES